MTDYRKFLVALAFVVVILFLPKRASSGAFLRVGFLIFLLGVIWSAVHYRGMASVSSAIPYEPNRVGQMFLEGQAAALNDRVGEIAPIGQTPCIAYEFLVLEKRSGGSGRPSYHTVLREQKGVENIGIQTPTGLVQVRPKEFDFGHTAFVDSQYVNKDFENPKVLPALDSRNFNSRTLNLKRALKVKEKLVNSGDKITAIGRVNNTSDLPILEDVTVSDKPIGEVLKTGRDNIRIGFLMAIVGFGLMAVGLIQ